jgi:alkanesulfonate monooxygenase SsuD/methylene tetrahydromethanopterin reductase-like flavin-dependent oxidoreductase (luciferase family)
MDLGYSVTSFHAGVEPDAAADALLDRAATARDAGFDYVEAGDHHVVSGGLYLQNVPTAARLAAVFDRVGAMFLLPLYDPVLVAEQAGTLAAYADEFDFWCAVGGNPASFDAFGVPRAERAPRLEEALALLDRLWTADDVTFDGEFYRVEGVSVNPKADPRVCVGGGAEPAVRRAGRLGDAWVAGPAESLADIDRKREWFADAGGGDLVVRRDALVLDDGDRAREVADDLLAGGYRGWPADADWVLAGSPDEVADDLRALRDRGADEVVVRPMSGEHAPETLRGVAEARELL